MGMKEKRPSVEQFKSMQEKDIAVFMASDVAKTGVWVTGVQAAKIWPHKKPSACQRLLDKMEKQGYLSIKFDRGKNWYCKRIENPLCKAWRTTSNEDLLGDIYAELQNL